jgi:hypothetical protein
LRASDGSYHRKTGRAGHGWLFATWTGRIITSGPDAPFGNKMNQSRSKLLGILSTLYIFYQAEHTNPIHRGSATYNCYECKTTMAILSKKRPSITIATQDNHDVIIEIFQIKKMLKTKITIETVRHSEDTKNETPEIAACEEVSHIANNFGSESPNKLVPRSLTFLLPLHKISVQTNSAVLTSKGSVEITTSIHKPALLKKVESDTKWPHPVVQSVDWQALSKAISSFSKLVRTKFTKLMFGLNQTNYLNNRYYGTDSTYPCCNKAPETFNHVLTCNSPTSTSAHLVLQEKLRSALETMSTPPQLIQLAFNFLSDNIDIPTSLSNDLSILHHSQSEIGWNQFLHGRISQKWCTVYSKLCTKQKVNPSIWTAWLITAIWHYTHSMWKHRNNVVHNQNNKVVSMVALSKLHDKTSELYCKYSNDPHLIPEYLCYLFKHPVQSMQLLSEDALRCWVDTIEEACHIQDSLNRESKGSVRCLYRFLGKEPPALTASAAPASTDSTGSIADQKDPALDNKEKQRSTPRIRKRN